LAFTAFGAIMGVLFVISKYGPAATISTHPPTTTEPIIPSPVLPTATVVPTGVTPPPPKELTICQAVEPNTLFIYNGPSRAARNVLEALYDGPIDSPAYQFRPTILAELPTPANKDVSLQHVQVQAGDKVLDVENNWRVELRPGVTVLNADGEEITFEQGAITMTQTIVTFTLQAGVTWADGHALTADDSVYAFELAGAIGGLPPHAQLLRDRTQSYEAVDEQTVVWTSIPGYRDTFHLYGLPLQNDYVQNFYHPLPRHAWGGVSPDHLSDSEVVHRQPLGWGPFAVEEWEAGQHITLVRNPHYYRLEEGLPYLDRVTFRFVSNLQQALDLIETGECDVINEDLIEGKDLTPLLEAAREGKVQLISSASSEWEHLDFGIEPSSWVRRPDYFGDVRVRQAIAKCTDRQRIASESFLYDGAVIAHSYVAAEHPLYADDRLQQWDYDPASGRELLEEVGWRDEDGDGIREAYNVTGVAWSVPFSVTLLTTSGDPVREKTAEILAENLADCGIRLGVQYLSPEQLIDEDLNSPVLGRNFELALFSWNNGLFAPCEVYLSSQIPGPENQWTAPNNPGYASAEYDSACQSALDTLHGTPTYAYYHAKAQTIFAQDLPVLPLYFVPKLVAVRPGVTGISPDPSEYLTWNIEQVDLTTE
jgi:peptide/nickel transport system substrate-binding protein